MMGIAALCPSYDLTTKSYSSGFDDEQFRNWLSERVFAATYQPDRQAMT